MSAYFEKSWVFWNHTGTNTLTGISAAALNGTPTSNAIDVGKWNVIRPTVLLTRVATTTLVLTATISSDGTNYGSYPSAGAVSSGASTAYALVYTIAAASTGTYVFPAYTVNDRYIKFALTGASAGASDLVSLQLLLGMA